MSILRSKFFWVGVFLSFGFSSLVLFRGIFTPLGIESFGRIWNYFIGWNDFGFTRRSFLGTILNASQIKTFFNNEYVVAYLVYFLFIVLTFLLFILLFKKIKLDNKNLLLSFAIFLSPGLIAHFAYTTGNLDILLFLFLMTIVFFTKSYFLVILLVIFGLLTHEMFIIFLPFIIACKATNKIGMRNFQFIDIFSKNLTHEYLIIIISIFSLILIMQFGTIEIAKNIYESRVEHILPNASFKHPHWSGFYELSMDINRHIHDTFKNFKREINSTNYFGFFLILIPLSYLLFLNFVFLKRSTISTMSKVIFLLSILCPLSLLLVANDWYRWIGFSMKINLLLILYLKQLNKIEIRYRDIVILLIFCIFGPFGDSIISRPLPLHQFVLEEFF